MKIDGKKTYIVALAIVIVGAIQTAGWIDGQTAQMAWAALGAGGLAALRHGVEKRL